MSNRSNQEQRIKTKYNEIKQKFTNKPINIVGRNGYKLNDVVDMYYDPLGDSSAADFIVIDSSGRQYKISCKQYNPINFCGSGLRSFAEDTRNGMIMNKWMKKVLGQAASYYISYLKPKYEKTIQVIGDAVLDEVRSSNNQNQDLSNKTKKIIEDEYEKFSSIVIPDIYVEIPDSFRNSIFRAETLGGPITHYILNGTGSNISINGNDMILNDCDILSTGNMVIKGETLYIVIRKRRADQTVNLYNLNASIDKRGFVRLFENSKKRPSETGARIQIREKSQLPSTLLSDIYSFNKTKRESRPPSTSIVLRVPL